MGSLALPATNSKVASPGRPSTGVRLTKPPSQRNNYGYNRPGAKVSEGVRESFWLQGMMAGLPASYFCIKAFSETDLTEDLKKIDVSTLILHGDDDQIVPIGASAMLSSKLVRNATLK